MIGWKTFLKRSAGKSFEKNDQLVLVFENYKYNFPQLFWSEYCGRKGHLGGIFCQAMKSMEFPKSLNLTTKCQNI